MPFREASTPIARATTAVLVVGLVLGASFCVPATRAQDDETVVRDSAQADFLAGLVPDDASPEPWQGWHGPIEDGLLGLRFGMDRYAVARLLRERGLEGRPSRESTLRFEGDVMGEPAELVAEFRPDTTSVTGDRFSRIQLAWLLFGVPNKSVRMFEELDAMLASRYGTPLLAEDDGFAALDTGWGRNRRYYVGTQAKAYLELRTVRSERFQLVLSLESPQLHVDPPNPDEE